MPTAQSVSMRRQSFPIKMKTIPTLIATLVLLALASAHAEERTWTRSDGKSLTAEFLWLSEATVVLKLESGRRYEMPVKELSVDDQAFIKTASKTPPRRPIIVPEKASFHQGSWYLVVLGKQSWHEAKLLATEREGMLATVKNQQTQDFLHQLGDGLDLWLGATDEKVEKLWMWTDGKKMDYSNWADHAPDNLNGNQHYLFMFSTGKWGDAFNRGRIQGRRMSGFVVQWNH